MSKRIPMLTVAFGIAVAAGWFWDGGSVSALEGNDDSAKQTDDAKIVFEDRFEGKLAEGWNWLREERAHWRLRESGRGLEIRVTPGNAQTVRNALVRDAPDRREGMYAFEVTVENLSPPTQQWEQAGLTWYHDDRAVTKVVKELIDGRIVVFPGFGHVADVPVRLRLEIRGDAFRSLYRVPAEDDEGNGQWQVAGSGTLPPAGSGRDRISLQCYHGPDDAEHWIRFTDFRILQLQAASDSR